tara:strand:- start:22 stop:237 length:216 start_codon:yes stop_codon:yes gene_type:complete
MTYKLVLKDLDKESEPGIWKLAVVDSEKIEDKTMDECLAIIGNLYLEEGIKGNRLKIIDNSKNIDSLNFPA